jgi:hypothetical protein
MNIELSVEEMDYLLQGLSALSKTPEAGLWPTQQKEAAQALQQKLIKASLAASTPTEEPQR